MQNVRVYYPSKVFGQLLVLTYNVSLLLRSSREWILLLFGPMMPSGASGMNVLDGGNEILPHPWIINIAYSMFGTHSPDSRRNVGIPCRTHAWE